MKKYTDEQLSLLLSEHDSGGLRAEGADGWFDCYNFMQYMPYRSERPQGCINQVIFNNPSPVAAGKMDMVPAIKFDLYYNPLMSAEQFLEFLETLQKEKDR